MIRYEATQVVLCLEVTWISFCTFENVVCDISVWRRTGILHLSLFIPAPPGICGGPLQVSDITKNACHLKWKPPEDDGGSRVTHYIVERKESGKPYWTTVASFAKVRIFSKPLFVSSVPDQTNPKSNGLYFKQNYFGDVHLSWVDSCTGTLNRSFIHNCSAPSVGGLSREMVLHNLVIK